MENNRIHEIRFGGQKVWVSLDLNNPMVKWNVAIGALQSPLMVKKIDNLITTFFMANRLKNSTRLEMECELEVVRFMEFPDKISRLQGLFFFDNYDEFQKAIHIPPFNRGTLVEASIEPRSYSRHDMNWITYYNKKNYPDDWCQKYWRGEECPFSEYGVPVWECITNKTLLILDETLRKGIYEELIKENNNVAFALQMGIEAVRFGYAVGNCFLRLSKENNHLHIRSFIRLPENECVEIIKLVYSDPNLRNNGNIMWQQIKKYPLGTIGEIPNFVKYEWCVDLNCPIQNCLE